MNTLENLRIFLRVAQTCSFTKTADDLGVNKSRISIVIRQLEDVLGVRLLHRTTRAVHLTEDGLAFYERAVEILSSVDDLQTMFVERTELKGKLRVDMPTDIANSIIIPKLPDFFPAIPALRWNYLAPTGGWIWYRKASTALSGRVPFTIRTWWRN
ncbi:LysR family transcriptional regulator [Serratia marcescens]|uniref:LysR family transcriptional regulator n=1 Tax=Serratia marcescens TaxID=615 RepID=UPI00132F1BD8|nr:hypothetical protein SMATCC274_28970 [Serratia marcescens]